MEKRACYVDPGKWKPLVLAEQREETEGLMACVTDKIKVLRGAGGAVVTRQGCPFGPNFSTNCR
jgi:hypothetical protein